MYNRYKVAFISKDNGYGHSVIGKLKETRVKRNLYYEYKDKVLEETTDGTRIIRKKRKTKVYGLYSTNDVRDNLIEILKERMRYHKDKIISPSIYEELRGLEIKKNGKVEHSDLTHDDQIFSYLMAMYVWYEGKNLRELYGIEKSGIKTEDDIDDIVQLDSDIDETNITKEIEMVNRPDDSETTKMQKELMMMQKNKGVMYSDFLTKQRKHEQQMLAQMLQNPVVKDAYAKKYGIQPDAVSIAEDYDNGGTMNQLPNSLFLDFDKDESEMSQNSIYRVLNSDYNKRRNKDRDNELQ